MYRGGDNVISPSGGTLPPQGDVTYDQRLQEFLESSLGILKLDPERLFEFLDSTPYRLLEFLA